MSALSDDASLTGVLTRDKWRAYLWQQCCDDEHIIYPSTISSSNDLADRQFSIISQSEILMQNLLKLDEDGKLTMQGLIAYHYPLSHIEEFLRLLLEVNEKRSSFRPEDVPVWGEDCTVMDRLNSASADFENFVAEYENIYMIDVLKMNRSVVMMLSLLYSEPVVIEVLQRWSVSAAPGEICNFVAVVENWHDFKEYPLDWTISMLRGEKVERVS